MKLGVVGLGLIGGSFAKAFKEEGHDVYAMDRDNTVTQFAILNGTVDSELTKENISACDLVLICVTPEACIEYLKEVGPYIGKHPIVMDCCGTKRVVCDSVFPLAEEMGFRYYGGHPMAGNHNSGFKYSRSNLFHGASMVIVPKDVDDVLELALIQKLLEPAGFGKFSITSADKHDEMIAFTSQMAHVVSNAYIKSPTAKSHKGFSAGSYKDLTRVAWLNPTMWAELFLENKDNLLFEIDTFIKCMQEYKEALENEDKDKLVQILDEGRRIKKEVDG